MRNLHNISRFVFQYRILKFLCFEIIKIIKIYDEILDNHYQCSNEQRFALVRALCIKLLNSRRNQGMFKTTSDLCITKTVCLFRSAFSLDQRKKPNRKTLERRMEKRICTIHSTHINDFLSLSFF